MAFNNVSEAIALINLIGHIIGAFVLLHILLVYVILFHKHSCCGWSAMAMIVSLMGWYISFALITGALFPLVESPGTSNVDLVGLTLGCKWDAVAHLKPPLL